MVLIAHPCVLLRTGAVPGVGIGHDRPFRLVGLAEEEPMPPGAREPRVCSRQRLTNGYGVQYSQMRYVIGMVHCQPVGDVASSVVPDDGEPVVTQQLHQGEDVCGHRPFRRLRTVATRRWGSGMSIPPQIRTHHGEPRGGEQRCHAVPCGVGPRMSVQQHDQWSRSVDTHPQANLPRHVNAAQREIVEHNVAILAWVPYTRSAVPPVT